MCKMSVTRRGHCLVGEFSSPLTLLDVWLSTQSLLRAITDVTSQYISRLDEYEGRVQDLATI